MKELWDELLQVLTETLEVYQAILTASQEKREVLVHGKVQELELLNQKEEWLILQAGKLDVRRDNLVERLAVQQGQAAGTALTELQSSAEPAVREQIQEIAAQFDAILSPLMTLNKLNTELIKQSLVFVNYSMNLLTQSESDNTYAPQGKSTQGASSSRRLFDQRV